MIRAINNLADVQQAIKDLQDSFTTQVNNAIRKFNTQPQSIRVVLQENGNTNAIAGGAVIGPTVSLTQGTVALVLLAHTLQAGANTFNGAPIVSAKNPANNIATGYAVGGVIQLFWTGSNWLDLSQ